MSRLKFTLAILFFSYCAFAQNDTINQTDVNDKRQGYWVKYHSEGGKKKSEGYFKDGFQRGTFKHYYPDGSIQTILKHRAKSDTSDAVYFHTNGKKMGEGIYVKGLKEGLWLFYDDREILSSGEMYSSGKKNGASNVFYLNNKLAKSENFVNDTLAGAYKEYFDNGKVKEEGVYKKGSKHGEVKMYYPNGVSKTIGNYALGKRHGKWVYFDEDGKVTAQEMYRYNKLEKQTLSEDAEQEKKEFQEILDRKEGNYTPEETIDE